ncbi:MAG: hypothetical protein KC420_12855, partial [Myxococcales bacterium]|nr:hypothetical protein [Myxococcales bacterium]
MDDKTTHDPELDRFIAAVARQRDTLDTAAPARPDFGEVIRRARELEPSALSEDQIAEADALAAVVPLAASREQSADDPALDAFIGDVRAHNEAVADERRLAGIPPLRASATRRRRGLRVAGILSAAAALALLVGGIWQGSSNLVQGTRHAASQAMMRGIADEAQRVRTSADAETAVIMAP